MNSAHQSTCGRRHRRLIDRLFVRGLSERAWRQLRDHIAECDPCRVRFDRLAQAERALAGGAVDLSPSARDRIAVRLIEDSRSPARRRWIWGGAVAAAVAAATVLLLFVMPRSETDELRRRGPGDTDAQLVPGERNPGLRLFCVEPTPGAGVVVDESRATARTVHARPLRCMIGAELQLAYSTPSFEGLSMIVFARDDTNRLFWYAPAAPEQTAISLAENVVDEPVPWSTRLAAKHKPGRYRITARFFDEPINAAAAVTAPALYEVHAELEVTGKRRTP